MGYNRAKLQMKKSTFVLLTAFLAIGMLMPSAFAESNTKNTFSKQQQTIEISINSGQTYSVAVYELKRGRGTVVIKKTIHVQYDDSTNKIIIDGTPYSWSRNPQYGEASTFGKYKYIVAGKYYFNWEYEGNGRFRGEL